MLFRSKPSLCGLITKYDVSTLKGVVLRDIILKYKKIVLRGDMLFTDNGVSGPVIFELSSRNSRVDYPYDVKIQLVNNISKLEEALQNDGNKAIKNVLNKFLPKSFVSFLLNFLRIDEKLKLKSLSTNTKVLLLENIKGFDMTFEKPRNGGETVFSGGVDLSKIGSNFESKLIGKLYFCGEILDVDGFCGGYNLQNCWTSGYLAGMSILETM